MPSPSPSLASQLASQPRSEHRQTDWLAAAPEYVIVTLVRRQQQVNHLTWPKRSIVSVPRLVANSLLQFVWHSQAASCVSLGERAGSQCEVFGGYFVQCRIIASIFLILSLSLLLADLHLHTTRLSSTFFSIFSDVRQRFSCCAQLPSYPRCFVRQQPTNKRRRRRL